jgi:hypothetical protein
MEKILTIYISISALPASVHRRNTSYRTVLYTVKVLGSSPGLNPTTGEAFISVFFLSTFPSLSFGSWVLLMETLS